MDSKENEAMLEPIETSGSVIELMTRAEIDTQIATAKRFPRDIQKFLDTAKSMATATQKIAESCMFAKPVAGDIVRGPSIRLAEIAIGAFQNLRVGARKVQETENEVILQGVCHDLENNSSVSVEVTRPIVTKQGIRYAPHVVNNTILGGISIALRNVVFRVIARAYIDEIYDAAREVAVGKASTLRERRERAVAYFGKMGIASERVLNVLERNNVEDITLDDLETLLGLQNSIKEGEVTAEAAFPRVIEGEGVEGLKKTLKDKAGKTGKPDKKKKVPVEKEKPTDRIDDDTYNEILEFCIDKKIPQPDLNTILGNLGYEKLHEVKKTHYAMLKKALKEFVEDRV